MDKKTLQALQDYLDSLNKLQTRTIEVLESLVGPTPSSAGEAQASSPPLHGPILPDAAEVESRDWQVWWWLKKMWERLAALEAPVPGLNQNCPTCGQSMVAKADTAPTHEPTT